ncbi:MAG TPA: Mth938-like domain-containing protein [Gemmatimonadota bacterium]|nr:Mth938-like domain-containing protein [Gemmatimonadota bacterium]
MTPQPPRVVALEWGVLEVEDRPEPYKDAKLWPGGSREWDWNETGTRHVPGVQLADVEEILAHGARSVVIGRGMHGRLEVPAETRDALADRGVALHAAPTPAAVETYHRLREEAPEVGALIHTTC